MGMSFITLEREQKTPYGPFTRATEYGMVGMYEGELRAWEALEKVIAETLKAPRKDARKTFTRLDVITDYTGPNYDTLKSYTLGTGRTVPRRSAWVCIDLLSKEVFTFRLHPEGGENREVSKEEWLEAVKQMVIEAAAVKADMDRKDEALRSAAK